PEGEGETPAEGETPIPHPADLNLDYRMVIGEAIAYLAGWQQGANPLAYAIRAAYLWQNGEDYVYDAAQDPPLCWVLDPATEEGEVPLEGEVPEGEGENPIEGETEEGEGLTETLLLPGDVPLEMVWIPGGTFMMGRYPGEQDNTDEADPQHAVTVPGFWLGKYEVTKAQYNAVEGTTPWSGQSYILDDPDSPAVYVDWYDAKAFVTRLNIHTGETFRLPSEAEWEYACRAGTTTRCYWGDDPSYTEGDAYCWRLYNAWNVGEGYAHVVGLKFPNDFGLFDMSGNVYEWCEDDWHLNYWGAPNDGSAWVYSPRVSRRVVRGGCFASTADHEGSAKRQNWYATNSDFHTGFRICR
ncbi:MAG TPA: formylglycine-generating enzyme family protein, partial [Candidatus Hydrogenedentes bacterium]|nr:formylglycine-generating enzyme family protein [Candidatus Hydrogenedentota bacterium]